MGALRHSLREQPYDLVLDLQGETVVGVDPRPGYLHRGIEKWMESRTYHQIIPMTDRLEYISCATNNLG